MLHSDSYCALRTFVQNRVAGIGKLFAQSTLDFQCGDCERNARCGLPPHSDCEFRYLRLARDDVHRPRRPSRIWLD